MAKSPIKNPPAVQIDAEEGSIPSLMMESNESSSSAAGNETVPVLDPPAQSSDSAQDSFGAGVWNNSKIINGLFSTNETRNSWISVSGIGWLKLANSKDSANEALTVVATAAKVKKSPVNYLLDNGQVTEIYVW